MASKEDIKKLEDARDKIAEVYKSQAIDDIPDNVTLTKLNNTLLSLNETIKDIKKLW